MSMLLRKELKAWLPFDDSATFDVMGNTWTAYGTPTISATNAFHGNALQLDGNSYIKTSVELGGRDFGIDCWVYVDPSTPGKGRIFSVVNPDNGYYLVSVRKSNSFPNYFEIWTNSNSDVSVDNGSSVYVAKNAVGQLVHITLVYQYDSRYMRLYVGTNNNYMSAVAQFDRRTFDIFVGASYIGTQGIIGTIDELRIYDGVYFYGIPDSTTYDSIRMTCDLSRKVSVPAQEWRYENPGTADLLTISGTTVNATATQSITHTAFYQTTQAKCFDIPSTSEIWMKFDVYFDGVNRWRAYNGGTNGTTGVTAQTSGYIESFVNGNNSVWNYPKAAKINTLQTILLHMVSGASAGVVEAWSVVNGQREFLGTYTGNVNQGQAFADVYLQSAGSGTLFSNVIISNTEIGFDERSHFSETLSLDVERRPHRTFTVYVDAERNLTSATQTVRLSLDTVRNSMVSILSFEDVVRTVIWTPKELFLKSWLRFDTSPTKDEFRNAEFGYGDTAPTITTISEIGGHALVLDGYTSLGGTILGFAGRSFSVDFWVNIDSSVCTECEGLFSIPYMQLSWKAPNELIFKTHPNGYGAGTTERRETNGIEFPGNVWNHVAIEYTFHDFTMLEGCVAELYVNGIKVATHDCPPYERTYLGGIGIGGTYHGVARQYRFVGMFAEVRFYDGDTLWKSNFTPPTAADYNAVPSDKLFYYTNPGMSHRLVDAWYGHGNDTQTGLSSDISMFGVATEFSFVQTCIMSNPTRDFWISFDVCLTRQKSAYLCCLTYQTADGNENTPFDKYDAWRRSGLFLGWSNNGYFNVYICDWQQNEAETLISYLGLPYTKISTGLQMQPNQRHKVCLHMLSASNGLIECWVDGSYYSYRGAVHAGMLMSDFLAWYTGELWLYDSKTSDYDRAQPLLSNIIVSNHPLTYTDNVSTYDSFRDVHVTANVDLDSIRRVTNDNRMAVDMMAERILHITETLDNDTERKLTNVVETEPFDTERMICTTQSPVVDAERALLNTVEFDVDTWRKIPHRLIINRNTRMAGNRFVL